MKLAVIGSRGFTDFDKLSAELDKFHQATPIALIISGGAVGADSMAERWADLNNIETLVFLPDWKKYERRAAFIRNKQIIDACDQCIAFWDGTSRGTKMSLDIAQKSNKKSIVIKV